MVANVDANAGESSFDFTTSGRNFNAAVFRESSSSIQSNDLDCMQVIRKSFRDRGFSEQSINIFMASWRAKTKCQYKTYLSKWFQFCCERSINSFYVSVNDVIEFLTELYNKGLGYSSLNTARSALSSLGILLEQYTAGSHPQVIRFMKGVFNLRPSTSRYMDIWDVDQVLCYLRKLSPVRNISLKDLTLKLAMLIALVNAARIQTVHLLTVKNFKKLTSEYVFCCDGLIKQSRPGVHFSKVHLRAYPPDRRLCVYTVMKEYLKRTKMLRDSKENRLLISFRKPHKAVSKDTVARWIKVVLIRSGIDTVKYGAHSVRAATTSKAKLMDVPLADIMKHAGWSNKSTFTRFYDKEIVKNDTVVKAVLELDKQRS
ncbi:uncharacterized protein LOC106161898 isoform X1 [Lingula anatina]|uniref:Uncharacterized protein LOC106161898 isoform X1 n=1 Tax=Lingula anatina TaxID=7574 RepID=A0A1S3IAJ0_LINAN|nr:uncharacterized protein LOC106161898 isoform X1 [Lingula anatina]|eukprot:XP_013394424.1 uncharacterized protein LOC106161898 isoform X1 [Lingula anatina]